MSIYLAQRTSLIEDTLQMTFQFEFEPGNAGFGGGERKARVVTQRSKNLDVSLACSGSKLR